jgi:hypothetical protein
MFSMRWSVCPVCRAPCLLCWPSLPWRHRLALARGRKKAEEDRSNYYKKRQDDKKKHMKRTAKGQPVTKNLISSILDKLQNE